MLLDVYKILLQFNTSACMCHNYVIQLHARSKHKYMNVWILPTLMFIIFVYIVQLKKLNYRLPNLNLRGQTVVTADCKNLSTTYSKQHITNRPEYKRPLHFRSLALRALLISRVAIPNNMSALRVWWLQTRKINLLNGVTMLRNEKMN